MFKTVLLFFIVVSLSALVYAEDAELGKNDFVTSAISDVFDKVGQYTSGEKTLLDPVENKEKKSLQETDPMGRPVSDPAIKPLRRPSAAE